MRGWERVQAWLGLVANLAILAGIVLVVAELRQNTLHLRLQLLDQINSRLYENNRVLMGANPVEAIEKSVTNPAEMTYADFRVVDAYLINAVHEWEDRYALYQAGLVNADEWKRTVDEDVPWFFGNPFAKDWWRTNGSSVFPLELADYVTLTIESVTDTASYHFFQETKSRSGS